MTEASTISSYALEWRYQERIVTEHFGSSKYSSSTKALGELVANSFDAGATSVEIELKENELGALDSITVSDNGWGISPKVLAERFIEVGVKPMSSAQYAPTLGRFGVGRLAVYRIGSQSKWRSISREDGRSYEVSFTLREDQRERLEVKESVVSESEPTGTTIEVVNLRDSGREKLTASRITNDLFSQFCNYLLGNPSRCITVQGKKLDIEGVVEKRSEEVILSCLS